MTHHSSVKKIKNKKIKIKRNPYLPFLFLVGMSPEPDIYFYLALPKLEQKTFKR